MSTRTKATVTLSAGGKSVTLDANTFARAAEAAAADRVPLDRAPTQQSFGFDVTHGFLGEELLLWLWFRWESDGGEFTLPGARVVGVAIDDLVVFAPQGDDETQQTLRHGLPTRTAEARTALRQGHRVAKAKLLIAEGSRQWTVTLDGATLTFGGVKLPEDAEECECAIDRTHDRAANWFALHEIVCALYGLFLRVRVSDGWQGEAARIAGWMRT